MPFPWTLRLFGPALVWYDPRSNWRRLPKVLTDAAVALSEGSSVERGGQRADAAALRYLQERHVLSVPFENLAFHLNEPVPRSVEAIRKIVYGGRGGCCFEPLFATAKPMMSRATTPRAMPMIMPWFDEAGGLGGAAFCPV